MRSHARKLSGAVRGAHLPISLLAGGELSQHFADEPRDRFHGGIYRAVHLRSEGHTFADFASGIHSRRLHTLQDYLYEPRAHGAQKPGARTPAEVRAAAKGTPQGLARRHWGESHAHPAQAQAPREPRALAWGSRRFRRRVT